MGCFPLLAAYCLPKYAHNYRHTGKQCEDFYI